MHDQAPGAPLDPEMKRIGPDSGDGGLKDDPHRGRRPIGPGSHHDGGHLDRVTLATRMEPVADHGIEPESTTAGDEEGQKRQGDVPGREESIHGGDQQPIAEPADPGRHALREPRSGHLPTLHVQPHRGELIRDEVRDVRLPIRAGESRTVQLVKKPFDPVGFEFHGGSRFGPPPRVPSTSESLPSYAMRPAPRDEPSGPALCRNPRYLDGFRPEGVS